MYYIQLRTTEQSCIFFLKKFHGSLIYGLMKGTGVGDCIHFLLVSDTFVPNILHPIKVGLFRLASNRQHLTDAWILTFVSCSKEYFVIRYIAVDYLPIDMINLSYYKFLVTLNLSDFCEKCG